MPTTKKVHAKIQEKAPVGWEHVVKALKQVPGVNPYAVANSMKDKGYQTHDSAGHPFDPHAMLKRHAFDAQKAAQAECGGGMAAESVSPTALGALQRKGVQDEAKQPKLGSGKRFANLTKKLGARKGKNKVSNPGALSAWIGRKNLGAKKFNALAQKGRKRAARKGK